MDSSTRTQQRRTPDDHDRWGHVSTADSDAAEPAGSRRARPAARVTSRGSARESTARRRSRRRRSKRVQRMEPRERTRSQGRIQPQARPAIAPSRAESVSQRRAARRARKRGQVQRASTRAPRVSIYRVLSWRMVSGVIVVGLVAVLYLFLSADTFYVRAVAIGGERYLSREEIFRFSDIAQRHIFWIDPADVEARLEDVPNIADADVLIGWPPDTVQIVVVEREPALIWEQQIRVWVDVNGIVMKQYEDRPDLLRVVVPNADEAISDGQRIPRTVVDGALQLKRRYPEISVLLYDSLKGLGHRDTRGWTVWFGTGEDISTKLLVYNALIEEIYPDTQPGEIDMSDPDRPTFTVLWRN